MRKILWIQEVQKCFIYWELFFFSGAAAMHPGRPKKHIPVKYITYKNGDEIEVFELIKEGNKLKTQSLGKFLSNKEKKDEIELSEFIKEENKLKTQSLGKFPSNEEEMDNNSEKQHTVDFSTTKAETNTDFNQLFTEPSFLSLCDQPEIWDASLCNESVADGWSTSFFNDSSDCSKFLTDLTW